MKILSLFDGISCAREALKRAGIKVDKYYASEIDVSAIEISSKNWNDVVHLGDIKEIGKGKFFNMLPKIDLMIGGSPCQDLSIAGKNRKGLSGERSGLFYEYVRVLNDLKPKYFILENVNSMPKESKDAISQLLGIQPVMINANLVSAQNRKRLFWIGKLVRGKYKQVEMHQPKDRGILLRDILEPAVDDSYEVKPKSNTIRTSGRGSGINDKHNWDMIQLKSIRVGDIGTNAQAHRIYSPNGKSVTLSALGGGQGAKTGLYAINKKNVAIIQKGRGYNKGGKIAGDKSPTLTSSKFEHNNHLTDGVIIRRLTPIECERLQGLPYDYTSGISNTQRYKCLGNAFNVDVIAHIIKNINK